MGIGLFSNHKEEAPRFVLRRSLFIDTPKKLDFCGVTVKIVRRLQIKRQMP